MPSIIKPKDFENYLPEEKDSVAASIVKFAQFSILFWRWFRSEFTSTGGLGQKFKREMCATGCPQADIVSEGDDDTGGEGDDPNPELNPDAGGGGNPDIPLPLFNPACCNTVYNYGRANKLSDPDEFGNQELINDTDFMFYEPTNYSIDLLCDGNNHKQLGIKGSVVFNSNEQWVNSIRYISY